jgi:hypothetical protein
VPRATALFAGLPMKVAEGPLAEVVKVTSMLW